MAMEWHSLGPRRITEVIALGCVCGALAGCVTTQPRTDGATQVNLSLSEALGLKSAKATTEKAPESINANQPPAVVKADSTAPLFDRKAKTMLEQALTCTKISSNFAVAESALVKAGWRQDQGITPVQSPQQLKVFGLSTRKVAISRDGFLHYFRSYFTGINRQQLIKAAGLKLGKDGRSYGRLTKLGVLEADAENGEITLTCTIDVEGPEG